MCVGTLKRCNINFSVSRTVSRATFVDGTSSSGRRAPRARGRLSPPASLRACIGATSACDSIRASVAEMVDDDEDQEELTTPIGLPGRLVAGRREEEIPSLHEVKTFFEAFYIGREHTTPNTQQPGRQVLHCLTTNSVFKLFERVFNVCTIGGSESGACNSQNFGRVWEHPHRLPTGTKVYRQYVSILDTNGAVERKSQCKVPTGGSFISTEEELGAYAGKLLEMPTHAFTREFAEIFADPDVHPRGKTEAARAKLKECISEHLRHALGRLARSRTERRARGVVANTNAEQKTGRVERRNTREVINDNVAHIEMCAEFLSNQADENGVPRLRLDQVEDFKTLQMLRTPEMLRTLIKQANAWHAEHPEWELTAGEQQEMLQRERRTGALKTQLDDAPREPIDSRNEGIDMADLEENLFTGNIASSPSESMRTKDLSQGQRCVLQNIINQTPRGNLNC